LIIDDLKEGGATGMSLRLGIYIARIVKESKEREERSLSQLRNRIAHDLDPMFEDFFTFAEMEKLSDADKVICMQKMVNTITRSLKSIHKVPLLVKDKTGLRKITA
jgi:hypothetical protein